MKTELLNQYNAALDMLKDCITEYSKKLWGDESFSHPAWRLAYHALFYANVYSYVKEEDIEAWPETIPHYNKLPKKKSAKSSEKVFTQGELLAFLDWVRERLPANLEAMDPKGDCWANWYSLNQFEFHLNNIRHIQHHVAQLLERHNSRNRIEVDWQRF
jgi:hypothetical protein